MNKLLKVSLLAIAFSFALASCGGNPQQNSSTVESSSQSARSAESAEEGYHLVRFDSDGGTEIPSQQVKHGEKIKKPADPIKAGFTFQKWMYAGEEWSFAGYVVTEDMTLKAKYSENEYWIEFVDQNQQAGFFYCSNIPNMSKRRKYGDVITLRAMPLAGYTLAGFYDDGKFLSSDLDYTFSVTKSMNISAKWKSGSTGYGIDIDELEHGRIEITKSRADAGETIAVKAIPDDGYRVRSMYRGKYVINGEMRGMYGEEVLYSEDHYISVTFENGLWGHTYLYAWNANGQSNASWPGVEYESRINFYELNKGRTGSSKFTHFILSDDEFQTNDLLISDYREYGSISLERATKSDQTTYYKATPKEKLKFFGDGGTFSFQVAQSCYVGASFAKD